MQKVNTDVEDSFYYKCGIVFARKLGDKPLEIRRKYVNEFKKFVDESGGPEAFTSVEDATNKFFYPKKRNSYGKR
jgi:hypothetical protein